MLVSSNRTAAQDMALRQGKIKEKQLRRFLQPEKELAAKAEWRGLGLQ